MKKLAVGLLKGGHIGPGGNRTRAAGLPVDVLAGEVVVHVHRDLLPNDGLGLGRLFLQLVVDDERKYLKSKLGLIWCLHFRPLFNAPSFQVCSTSRIGDLTS